ncbi:winged helix-turn-helix transcriptional regulator [Cupriavidus necator]|uniref:winged helix-turn-helix transcriptional regulator n=1 Tax=Cupriavidus necator TaxID=106590 RepID=UPI0039C02AE1
MVGDKWTLLVLRELYMGVTRFDEIQVQTSATPQMLANRLKSLEANGLVERRPYSEKPLCFEYQLTRKGWALYPVTYALRAWGEAWCKEPGEEVAVRFVHPVCGHDVHFANVCAHCGAPVSRDDLDAFVSAGFQTERQARREIFK